MTDDQLRERFGRLGFAGEPPMTSTARDDLDRGRRYLRRRRAVALGGGVATMVAVAASVALALPNGEPSGGLPVAGGGSGGDAPTAATTTQEATPPAEAEHELPYPTTRQLLLDTAVEHLDPTREHLPWDEETGFTGGGYEGAPNVGIKLGWTNAGEDGEGLVQVAVTGPGFVDADEYAVESFIADFGCDLPENCTEQNILDSEATALVAGPDPERNLLFAVSHERADGSMVGVAVYDVFGNNTVIPVTAVDITLDQAIAFVTDGDLVVDPAEAAAGWDGFAESAECAGFRESEERQGTVPEGVASCADDGAGDAATSAE